MALQDQELIAKAKGGDKQAFTELYDRYSGRILSYIYRYIGDYQTAEDMTIETFLNAYNALPAYEERGTFISWLYAIATNFAKRELRRRSRHKEFLLDAPASNGPEGLDLNEMIADESTRPDYEARKNELLAFIEKILAGLGKKYKEAFLLCDVDGVSQDEAAKILKSNSKTIGTRVRRARKAFYAILQKYGYKF